MVARRAELLGRKDAAGRKRTWSEADHGRRREGESGTIESLFSFGAGTISELFLDYEKLR